MSSMVCNSSKAVIKFIRHLDSCDISDKSDSRDSRQGQTCMKHFSTDCISNEHNFGFRLPWVCAILALVFLLPPHMLMVLIHAENICSLSPSFFLSMVLLKFFLCFHLTLFLFLVLRILHLFI